LIISIFIHHVRRAGGVGVRREFVQCLTVEIKGLSVGMGAVLAQKKSALLCLKIFRPRIDIKKVRTSPLI
jgi:hypothetical protein